MIPMAPILLVFILVVLLTNGNVFKDPYKNKI